MTDMATSAGHNSWAVRVAKKTGRSIEKSPATGRLVRSSTSDAETAYLLGTAANAEHLRRALGQMESGKTHEQ